MVATTFDLPAELRLTLAAEARASGKDEAEIVREAPEQFLRDRPRPRSLSVGIVDDPDLNGVDSEDWLLANLRPE
jgi:hypothetical protein